MSSQETNPQPLKLDKASFQPAIHADTNQKFFLVSKAELSTLEEGSSNIWRDLCLFSIGLAVPSAINAIAEFFELSSQSSPTWDLFLNALVALLFILLAGVSGFSWYKADNKCKELLQEIKSRAPYNL
jgi:hypothetical protein